jgi:glycosyltransferase 2 family protein
MPARVQDRSDDRVAGKVPVEDEHPAGEQVRAAADQPGQAAAAATLPILAASVTARYRWAFLAVPIVLLCMHPRVLNPLIDRLLRLTRRPAMEQPLSGRAIVSATLWAVLSWVLFGIHVWLMAVRLGAPAGRTALLAVGGFAFAWCIGFLVVFARQGPASAR